MATIQGTLTDGDGNGIADADITITESGSNTLETETTTDSVGDYSASVAADTYDVRATKFGYDPVEKTSVVVGSGETVTVNLSTTRVNYKIRGEFTDRSGTAVLGQNEATTGAPIGVLGATPNAADGYGLASSGDMRLESGQIDVADGDFVVEAGTTDTGDAQNVVMGHASNTATSGVVGGVVGGGGKDDGTTIAPNKVKGDYATVSGGQVNEASGAHSIIPGGKGNTTTAPHTFAGGTNASAAHEGAFIWCDTSSGGLTSANADEFAVSAAGGVFFFSNESATTGVKLPSGSGSWSSVSSQTLKSDLVPVDGPAVLDRVADLDVATWSYDAQDESVRHMGPMAEDFYEAFELGTDPEHISNVDADGVALAAIQGLSERLEDARETLADKDARVDDLEAENEELRARNDDLDARLAAIEERLGIESTTGQPTPAED